jgi:hypothetical protein
MNDLDLSALSTGPVPALASPSDIKARGDQRRTRGRVALAGAAALVVLAGAGTAVALTGGGKPDALVPAGPSATPSPSAMTPDGSDELALLGALAQPSDAAAVLGGTWLTPDAVSETPEVLLELCDEGGTQVPVGLENHLVDLRGGIFTTQVVRFAPGEAARYMANVPRLAARCPADAVPGPEDGENFPPRNAMIPLHGSGTVGVKHVLRSCGEKCEDDVAYWVIVSVGDLVGFVTTDDRSLMQPWAERVRARLEQCLTACPSPEERHPRGFPDDVSPAIGRTAWVVTVGGAHPDGTEPETAAEGAGNARRVGYDAKLLRVSCLEDYLPSTSQVDGNPVAAVVAFDERAKAAAFQDRYSSTTGGFPSAPVRVTFRCLS